MSRRPKRSKNEVVAPKEEEEGKLKSQINTSKIKKKHKNMVKTL
jgi:hypothetical protein